MKSRHAFLSLGGAALLVSVAGAEGLAQHRNGQWRLPARAPGRQVAQTPRAEPQVVVVPPVQSTSLLIPLAYRVPVAIVPAVLMSDGSIFANFGFGFEPVVRVCSGGATMGAVVASNGVVLQPAPAVNYTQPAPNVTMSQLLSTGLPVYQVVVSDMARLACFNNSGSGLVYVYR